MGLFNSSSNRNQQQRSRTRLSESEQQALKAKARNRLIGAIVLIILAIVVIPVVLDTNKAPVIEQQPPRAPLVAGSDNTDNNAAGTLSVITAPGIESNGSASTSQLVNTDGTVSGDIELTGSVASDTALIPEPVQETPVESVASGTSTVSGAETAPAGQVIQKPERTPEPKEVVKKPEPERTRPAEVKKPDSRVTIKEVERTDDGSRALALLEGRSPTVKPKSSTKVTSGNYSLQVASYSSSKDAQDRREKLVASGVSNAHVQSAMVNGKQQYRLRVGPFNSREAAQAAQTRLRTLGYDNGFISSN